MNKKQKTKQKTEHVPYIQNTYVTTDNKRERGEKLWQWNGDDDDDDDDQWMVNSMIHTQKYIVWFLILIFPIDSLIIYIYRIYLLKDQSVCLVVCVCDHLIWVDFFFFLCSLLIWFVYLEILPIPMMMMMMKIFLS